MIDDVLELVLELMQALLRRRLAARQIELVIDGDVRFDLDWLAIGRHPGPVKAAEGDEEHLRRAEEVCLASGIDTRDATCGTRDCHCFSGCAILPVYVLLYGAVPCRLVDGDVLAELRRGRGDV